MHNTHVWHQFYLSRAKVILFVCLCMVGSAQAQSYLWARKNNPNYDNRKFSYGFLIGLHTSTLQLKYADNFVDQDLDTVHSIIPDWRSGFSLGFIVNYKVAEFVDLRITPKVSFYEHSLTYRYTDKTSSEKLIETTTVEFPLLLKYKSDRRGNVRMYMVGGINPAIEASGKKDQKNISSGLEVKSMNASLEAGIGFDLYFPLFKFSPEIRFSKGIMNILDNTENVYGEPLKYVNTNTISIYLLFQ